MSRGRKTVLRGESSKTIVLDKQGNIIDELAERNEEIKQRLQPILDKLLAEKEEDEARAKPAYRRYGYRLVVSLNQVLRSYPLRTTDELGRLDYDTIEDNFHKYMDLVSYYNQYFDFVANKQDFCAFMRVNLRKYQELEQSEDDEIARLMGAINDYFISLGFSGGEMGNLNATSTAMRLKTRGAGHNLRENRTDASYEFHVVSESPAEIASKVANLLGESKKKG